MKGKTANDDQMNNAIISVSEDKLEAYIYLCPSSSDVEYTEEELINLLNNKKIVSGIDMDVIRRIIQNKLYYKILVIARGKKPIDGIDGYFEFLFNTNIDKRPKILEDGSVDYLSLDIVESVSAGEDIVKYHPAIKGSNGYNVLGAKLLCKRGRELAPLRGKGFYIAEDNVTYKASVDGKIDYRNDKLIVSNLLEIDGDIDISTGNLNFAGDILIKGNIDAGMSVRASGNIIVNGHVESAKIYAGKDVILRNGMQGGQKGMIEAGGNVSGKFFEQVTIKADGNVNANAIMNCMIESGEEVIVSGKLGIIVGGVTNAIRGITATIIGNMSEAKTILKVGVSNHLFNDIMNQEKVINELVEEINKIEDAIDKLNDYMKQNPENQNLSVNYTQLLATKVSKNKEIMIETDKRNEILKMLEKSTNAQVVIHKLIHPGTKVVINGTVLHITDKFSKVTLKRKGIDICIYANE